MRNPCLFRYVVCLLMLGGAVSAQVKNDQSYDVVIRGGRVVDPETSLDAVRNVGIRGHEIAAISEGELKGARIIDASGLVVAPGFIDLHQHDLTAEGYRLKAMDGVTTALELEIGPPDVRQFLDARRGKSLIHFGTSASHPWARAAAFDRPGDGVAKLPPSSPATNNPATKEQLQRMRQRLRDEMRAGGLGVGMGVQYTPGASRQEVIEMFQVAAERGLPVFVHARGTASNRWVRSLQRRQSPARLCISSTSTAVVCEMLPTVCAWWQERAGAGWT